MLYFAYGSNMSVKRIKNRIASVCKKGTGELKGYKIVCNKMSNDESLKFNIQNDVNESVFGVVYNVSDDDLDELDKFEGVIKSGKSKGKGYIREIVKVIYNDNSVEAITYICTCGEKIDNSGENKPYSWYVKHALIGAREAELDRLYIEEYINIKSKEDGDKGRVKRELKIYS